MAKKNQGETGALKDEAPQVLTEEGSQDKEIVSENEAVKVACEPSENLESCPPPEVLKQECPEEEPKGLIGIFWKRYVQASDYASQVALKHIKIWEAGHLIHNINDIKTLLAQGAPLEIYQRRRDIEVTYANGATKS